MQRLRGCGDVVVDDGANGDESRMKAVAVMVVLPTAPAPPPDRLRVRDVGEGVGGTVNLVPCAPALTPTYYCVVQWGATNH